MIQMNITSSGEAAITRNENITFTKFIAGSGNDDTYTGCAEPKQEVPIGFSQTYVAGETYNINGVDTVVSTNSVRNVGVLINQNASSLYQWKELALMAREGAGEEFAFAYGYVLTPWATIDPDGAPVSYSIPFDVVFTSSPSATATVTEMGVGWIDFLEHTQSKISDSGAHGMRLQGGDLWINGVPADLMKRELFKQGIGVSSFVSALPLPQISLLGNLYCIVPDNTFHRLRQTEVILEGQYIYQDSVTLIWHVGDGTHPNSLLVVSDEVETPQPTEIHLTDAQNHFLTWDWVSSVDARLRVLETPNTSAFLTHTTEDGSYNKEWVDRMTGAGTAASPYLIYTPKDFNNIRTNLAASYRLMNNIDFSEVIGIPVSLEGNTLIYGEVNTSAPLYNAGKGFLPIGPTTGSETGAFTGVLDGNGKKVRGIVMSDAQDYMALFTSISGASFKNIIFENGFIINTKNSGSCYTSGVVGKVYIHGSFLNVINCNTVIANNTTNTAFLAGVVCYTSVMVSLENCVNHGKIIANNSNTANIAGLIAGGNSPNSTVKNCYNTSNLNGSTVAGLVLASGTTKTYNSFSTGSLEGGNKYPLCHSFHSSSSNNYFSDITQGTSNQYQTVKAPADMKTIDFVNALNSPLLEPVFTQDIDLQNGGYPLTNFEKNRLNEVPANLSVALLDTDHNTVYSSKMPFQTLQTLSTKRDLQEILDRMPRRQEITLTTAGWSSNTQTITISSLLTTNKVDILPIQIKKYADAEISYLIQAGSIEFTATTTPTADINLTALIWKGI